jgi:hypothetical protein
LQPPCAMAVACGQPSWAMAVVFLKNSSEDTHLQWHVRC